MSHLGDDVAAWVDGELDGHRSRRAAQHLSRCTRCRAAVTEERQIRLRLRLTDDPAPSGDLAARVIAAACSARARQAAPIGWPPLGPAGPEYGRGRRLKVLVACAAAGALVGVAGLAVGVSAFGSRAPSLSATLTGPGSRPVPTESVRVSPLPLVSPTAGTGVVVFGWSGAPAGDVGR